MNNINKIIIPNHNNLSYISSVYDDNITLLELILSIIKTLNSTIDVTNSNNDFINSLDNTIDIIKSEIDNLKLNYDNIVSNVNSTISSNFETINSKIVSLFSDYKTIFNSSLKTLEENLNKKISDIVLGNIIVYDPTTGSNSNINTVINNIFDTLRQNSITCQFFDNLELTASVFDLKQVTAFDFDVNGNLYFKLN